MGTFGFFTMYLLYFTLLSLCSLSYGLTSDRKKVRKPKLFYVSTSDVETTVTTITACWTSSDTAATTCKKRKRRAMIEENFESEDDKSAIMATRAEIPAIENDEVFNFTEDEVREKMLNGEMKVDGTFRDPKFLQYWLTTTRTFTSTSITATYTIYSLACTPGGWPYAACG